MNTFTFLWYFLVAWIIIFPLVTVLHELGHALTALVLTNLEVTITLGRGHIKWQWGRLKFAVGWFSGFIGFARYDGGAATPYQNLLVALAGPVVSLLLAILCWNLQSVWVESLGVVELVMRMIAYAAFAQFLFAIIPIRYPPWFFGYRGHLSDGARIIQMLRIIREQSFSKEDKLV